MWCACKTLELLIRVWGFPVLSCFHASDTHGCAQGNHACDGGLDFRGYAWMLAHDGSIATEATYPYLNSDGYCRFESSTVGATITGYANLSGTVADMNDALATVGPISVSVDAAPNSFYFYQGGLYYDEDCKSGMGDLDHTVRWI